MLTQTADLLRPPMSCSVLNSYTIFFYILRMQVLPVLARNSYSSSGKNILRIDRLVRSGACRDEKQTDFTVYSLR